MYTPYFPGEERDELGRSSRDCHLVESVTNTGGSE